MRRVFVPIAALRGLLKFSSPFVQSASNQRFIEIPLVRKLAGRLPHALQSEVQQSGKQGDIPFASFFLKAAET